MSIHDTPSSHPPRLAAAGALLAATLAAFTPAAQAASGAGDATTSTGQANAFDIRCVRAWQFKN